MAKLTRVTGKIFGETASPSGVDPEIGQFGSAKAGTYNGTSDIATIQSLPAWSNGWIDAVTPSNQYPPLPERTGVDKVLSYQECYLLQQGVPEWDSATTYYENGFCTYNGIIYKSLQDDNLNQQPDTATAYWTVYGAVTDYADHDLQNLTTLGNSRLEYAPFSINNGTITDNANGTLTFSGADITCSACTITTADGRTKIFNTGSAYGITTEADGDYAVFKNFTSGALSLVALNEFVIGNEGLTNCTNAANAISGGADSSYPLSNAFDNKVLIAFGTSQRGSTNILGHAYIGCSSLTKPVKKVKLYQGLKGTTVNYCTGLKFQYSDDGVTWNDIDTITDGANLVWQEWNVSDYTPSGATHSFRVLAYSGFAGAANNFWAIDEFKIYAEADYYLDNITIPASMYANGTLNNDLVYMGNCTVVSGAVTAIINRLFNNSDYLVNKNYLALYRATLPNMDVAINKATTGFIADEDGWVFVYATGNLAVQINSRNFFACVTGSSQYNSGFAPLKKGDVVEVGINSGSINQLIFHPMRKESEYVL